MNDKQQLAAMGEHLAEQQPLRMAKRIEELESKYKAALDVVRDLVELPYSTGGLIERLEVRERARDLLAVHVPAPAVPEGWKLVPVQLTPEMWGAMNAGYQSPACSWQAALAAAPSPDSDK